MKWLGRSLALILIILILIVTPAAFWIFNFQRVALDPQTYKTALRNQNVYQDLLPALVDEMASESNDPDPARREALKALVTNMPEEEWAVLSDKLVPPSWLQNEVEGNINRIFSWLDGARNSPGIGFDLTELKARLSGNPAREAAEIVVPRLPACTPAQNTLIEQAAATGDLSAFPLCNPEAADKRQIVITTFTNVLYSLGLQLPARWDLNEQLRQSTPRGQRVSDELSRLRAGIWLQSRLTPLLFLIPLALLSMIVIVVIRSGKQFFRWTGWALIGSGLLTLIPVPIMPGLTLGLIAGSRTDIQEGFGESGRLLASLVGGMVTSIASGLTLGVLVQVAVVIGLGFLAVVVSVLLPSSEPEINAEPVMSEQWSGQPSPAMQAATPSMATTMGSTPRPKPTAETELADEQP